MAVDFIKLVQDDNIKAEYRKLAYQTIVTDLLIKNLHNNDRARTLEFYESEGKMNEISPFIPGCFYIFKYDGEPIIQNGIKFKDTAPVILALRLDIKRKDPYITGLNFNMMTAPVRAGILQELVSCDSNFFNNDLYANLKEDKYVFSKKLTSLLMNDNSRKKFVEMISDKYKINKNSWAWRKYFFSKISRLRMIDYWQWKFLPFLEYGSSVKGVSLKKIQADNLK